MMLTIKILSGYVEEHIREKNGKTYRFREQYASVVLFTKDGKKQDFSRELKVPLDSDQPPYQPGEYQLSPASLYLDKYQNLTLQKHIKLVPVAVTKVA